MYMMIDWNQEIKKPWYCGTLRRKPLPRFW